MIYEKVVSELDRIGADVEVIGYSECGRKIFAAHTGPYRDECESRKQIVITAGIHARECYTALVVLRQIEYMTKNFCRGGVYFVPLVNPDGAEIFENGDASWKANALGVDLNCNFDARWGTGKQNVFAAGAAGYIGKFPLCASESKALYDFTMRVKPDLTVSYHCMGGELYWEFFQKGKERERDRKIADKIARHIGVKRVDGDLQSAGGYKDFCVQTLKIPAVTIELLDRGEHPFCPQDFDGAAIANEDLPQFILDILQ